MTESRLMDSRNRLRTIRASSERRRFPTTFYLFSSTEFRVIASYNAGNDDYLFLTKGETEGASEAVEEGHYEV